MLITDLDQIRALAAQRRDAFEVMRYLLEASDTLSDAELDARVDALAAPIVASIDCTTCGNCCRSLDVYLEPADAERLAAGIDVPLAALMADYVDQESAQAVDEWGKFRQSPCAFLRGTVCSVYAHRPEACRMYPQFTPDFRWTVAQMLDGAALCPIVYHVLDAVEQRADAWDRGEPA